MRCAHVIPYMGARAGGPVVVVDRLCRHMARRRVESVVLTTELLSDNPGTPTGDGVPPVDACQRPGGPDGDYELRVHANVWGRFAYAPALGISLDEIVPTCDVVHIHTLWTYTTAAAVRACRRHGVPFVLMPHGMLDPNSLARKRVRKRLYGRLFEFRRARAAAAIAYTTQAEKRLAEQAVSRLPDGHVVPLGTDAPPDTREALANGFLASRPHLADRKLVIFLGRVHPKKGLDLLIPAFARAALRVRDAHLLIVGPDDDGYYAAVEKQIHRLGLHSCVTRIDLLTGEAKWQALAASRLFALPSWQENFGIAIAEAMRVGTPVVISNRVNIWPDVEAADAGFVAPCDVDATADALIAGLTDDAAWPRWSANAVAAAETRFNWTASADRMLDVYRIALGRAWRCGDVDASPGVASAGAATE